MQSAVAELQHLLASPPTQQQHQQQSHPQLATAAAAHVQLQALRDQGDSNHLFLRNILELTSQPTNIPLSPHQQEELLFHCIQGCRHVLLLKWTTCAPQFRKSVRDYFLGLGLWMTSSTSSSSSLPSSSFSRTLQMAYFNACASFWKRSWVEDLNRESNGVGSANTPATTATATSTEQTLMEQMHHAFAIRHPQTSFSRLESPAELLFLLQQILTTSISGTTTNSATATFPGQQQASAARFLMVLVGEFAGRSASQYHLPLEFHKKAHQAFERGVLAADITSSRHNSGTIRNTKEETTTTVVVGLYQCLVMSMKALGQWVLPKLLMVDKAAAAGGSTAIPPATQDEDEAALAILQLTIDVIGWEWGAEDAWDTHGGSTTLGSNQTLLRPPTQWRELLLQPEFAKAIFHIHHSKGQQLQQQQLGQVVSSPKTIDHLLHSLRQLILLLASLTGSIFSSIEERQHFANMLLEGTLGLLQTPEIASFEDSLLVDSLSLVSRLFVNYKMSILAQLPLLPNVLERFAAIGKQLLQDNLQESEQTAGDLELMENREWREEALKQIVEGLALLCSDPWLLYSGSQEFRQSAKASLGKTLGPLYVDFVTCRTRMARLEEMYYTAHETELDEVREEIFALDLEQEMTSLANVGRLDLGASLGCLSHRFQQLIPQLQALWGEQQGSSASSGVTPDAAGLLEESRLVTMHVGYLLTDDNEGETPVIPDTVFAACQQNEEVTHAIVGAVQTIQQFAEFQATKVAQNPSDPRWSPLLAKEFLWFFHRWAPAYILPADYGASSGGGSNTLVQAWASPERVQETISFVISLSVHYHCHWPQERQVQENATILLQAMAKRCKQLRLALVGAASFRELISFHCLTSGIRHSASTMEFEATVHAKKAAIRSSNNNETIRWDMLRGYQRLPYDIKSKILTGLLIGCSEYDDESSKNFLNDCLGAIDEAFSSLVHALSSRQMDPSNVDAKEMAALCVELYGGVARAGEMVASERISKFLTPSLAHLSGLMSFYAEDLTICESLLRLFRDYAEQFIAVLDSEPCLVLFQASANLLKSYSSVHCASTRVIVHSSEEEQNYNDILCAIQLLIQLGTKDFIGFGDSGGLHSNQVTDIIFYGLQQILPLMTRGLLQFPTLCTQYFSLVGFMMETYPEKVKDLPYELLDALLESLLYGMSHHDTSVAKASLQGLAGIVKEHAQHRVLDVHLARNADLFDKCSYRLLMEVVFQTCVWDRIETAGLALLHLAVVDLNRFGGVAQSICQQISTEQQHRLSQSLQQLLQPEVLSQVFATGYEGRQNRIRFKKDFENFCHEIHSFLVLK